MIYCKRIEMTETSAIYKYGPSPEEMDGEIEFFSNGIEYAIIKEPTNTVYNSWIHKLMARHDKDFTQGIFPEKIAFESH